MLHTDRLPADLHRFFMTAFRKWIQNENSPDDVLYHYTSLTSLMGMVESRKIWMSKADFLNDSSEMIYFADILRNSIVNMKAENRNESWQRYIWQFEKSMYTFLRDIREDGLEVYVFSLSHNKDSLALWYNYAQGDGYNLGFKTENLLKKDDGIADFFNIIHGYVLYREEDQEKFLNECLRSAYEWIAEQPEQQSEGAIQGYFEILLTACATFFKNPAFKSEEEYRLAAITGNDRQQKVEFRARHGIIIPFIAVDLGETLPISEVTIGPKNNIDVAQKGMEYYLKSKGFDLKKVKVSKSIAALRY
ncbi:DUF2971 domain-containing protein [Planococcus sp. CAU13]|uniref:DUF2971 domain-containing protein n=1 Tax=Planococcus sp. CAU13 TaxID=1541197 RepID=UPI000689300D|nr:DUF2971 domain-containing protein [Planococcus sp. CAU13]